MLHQELLVSLQEFTDWIVEKSETMNNLKTVNVCDVEDVKQKLQLAKASISYYLLNLFAAISSQDESKHLPIDS